MNSSVNYHLIIGIGVGVGVVTFVVHVLRRQTKDEIIRTESNRISRAVRIPKGFVGHVLGRRGETIKGIREKSKARVTLDDSGNEFTVATICGSPEAVEEAADLINQIITSRHACVTKEFMLQENVTDSVWKNINCIRQICDHTRSKITFDFTPSKGQVSEVKIIIKGKQEEVDAAVQLIDELVADVEVNSTRQTHVAGRALPENLPLQTATFGNQNLPCERLIPNSSDGFLEIYVSSVDNPNKFWAQISGSKSIQLDKLATEMTNFYSEEKNRERFQVNSINVGDIVSAFFQGDNSWYRAQVIKVNNEDSDQKTISVFYLDFGDCGVLTPNLITLLKPDYLSIPFQAIECSLADIGPVGAVWTQEATEAFEKMVYLGQWKVIMAKPIDLVPSQNDEKTQCDNIQLVQLLDTNTNRDINVSEELVLNGFAEYV